MSRQIYRRAAEKAFGTALKNLSTTATKEFIESIAGAAGQNGTGADVGTAVTNSVQNSFNEMSFKGMHRRSFQFTWSLAPKSFAELEMVDEIIQRLRFAAHPGLSSLTTSGSYLDFPGTIDIEWYTKGTDGAWVENAWIP